MLPFYIVLCSVVIGIVSADTSQLSTLPLCETVSKIENLLKLTLSEMFENGHKEVTIHFK